MQRQSQDVLLARLTWASDANCQKVRSSDPKVQSMAPYGVLACRKHNRLHAKPRYWACTSASICSARSGL